MYKVNTIHFYPRAAQDTPSLRSLPFTQVISPLFRLPARTAKSSLDRLPAHWATVRAEGDYHDVV